MRKLRIRWCKLGKHYHCRLFSGIEGFTFAKLGELVLDEDDWKELGSFFGFNAEFIEDDPR